MTMKRKLLVVSLLATVASLNNPSFATTQKTMNTSLPNALSKAILDEPDDLGSLSQDPKIQAFLKKNDSLLSSHFPYRINLPKAGQVAKNNAGIRIAETANQLASDTTGLLFYYKLLDHAMRVPHWHGNATEIGIVLTGKMRITIWEGSGKPHVFTVEKNGTWTIPPGTLHCLENVENSPLTFIVGYDSPITADRDFATAWASLPDEMLEKALGLTQADIADIRKTTVNRLSKYDPANDKQKTDSNSPFSGNFSKANSLFNSELGSIRRLDEKNVPKMTAMSLQQTILKPNAMRQPHWYLGADTLLYVYKGTAFFTMMDNDGTVYNALIKPGDVVYIPMGVFHSYVNVGKENLELYETFEGTKTVTEISLLEGSKNLNPQVLAGATGISQATAQRLAKTKTVSPYIISL